MKTRILFCMLSLGWPLVLVAFGGDQVGYLRVESLEHPDSRLARGTVGSTRCRVGCMLKTTLSEALERFHRRRNAKQ